MGPFARRWWAHDCCQPREFCRSSCRPLVDPNNSALHSGRGGRSGLQPDCTLSLQKAIEFLLKWTDDIEDKWSPAPPPCQVNGVQR